MNKYCTLKTVSTFNSLLSEEDMSAGLVGLNNVDQTREKMKEVKPTDSDSIKTLKFIHHLLVKIITFSFSSFKHT